ncbi:MAG TPA: sigma-70 family RNA polymerase sigma factor [Xanthobacteraceae bacterium]|jgi:DNA-directed RNA polymerase specialized sigma24 family protein
MERFTEGSGRPIVTVDNTTVDVARAIHALSSADLVRLKALARLWTRGQDALGWSDVLHEAIARALGGARRWPPGVPIVAFLSGIMRSICEDHWRRARREGQLIAREEDVADLGGEDAASDPERTLAAAQALAAVNDLFAGDAVALMVIAGLADGLSPPEICRLYGLTDRDYDTTRRRMRRALLRHGLAGSET